MDSSGGVGIEVVVTATDDNGDVIVVVIITAEAGLVI